jgi:hypothetical protein
MHVVVVLPVNEGNVLSLECKLDSFPLRSVQARVEEVGVV